jgi:hypothetical protein
LSRVVKGKLDGVLNDINGLRGGEWTFDAAGGRVKEEGRERGASRAAGGGGHKRDTSTDSVFQKHESGGCVL